MKIRFAITGFAFFVIQCASAQDTIKLYKDLIPNNKDSLFGGNMPYLQVYYPENRSSIQSSIIIIPGGAYSFLANKEEGTVIAKEFASKGITAFVLNYRLPNRNTMIDKSMGPIMDAQQALKIIRENATKWNINPSQIGVIGFSAGGHLASTLGTHFNRSYISNPEDTNLRPDFMVLVYSLISMEDSLSHTGSKISLLGMEPTKTAVTEFSNELHVTEATPPTYLTHCEDDQVVDVKNSIVFYQALQKQGVSSELHLVPKGDHGFIQRIPISEWLDPILKFLTKEGFYSNH